MDLKEHLKALCELHAPSAYEAPVRDYLRSTWADYVDEFQNDALGSLIGIKHGEGSAPRRRIMLSAHMDEIGLMVAEIRAGYLRLENMGGVDQRILPAKSLMVHGKRPLIGTVAAVPPHISKVSGDGKKTYPPLDQQWVDLGLPSEEVAELVSIGDVVTLDAPFLALKGGLFASKAMDNRASVAAVSHALDLLQKRRHQWDVLAVATVQEEKGAYGAATSAFYLQPDLAIAIDVSFAKQHGVNNDGYPALGKGVLISLGVNFHPHLAQSLQDSAKTYEIPFSLEFLNGHSGTDAWMIQIARQGIPTALLNIPLRNMHSSVETVSLKDIKRVGRLIAEFITDLDDNTLTQLAWENTTSDETEEED